MAIIGSDNRLLPVRCQAIIWTNGGILSIWTLRTYFSEIEIKIQLFIFIFIKESHFENTAVRNLVISSGARELSLVLPFRITLHLFIRVCYRIAVWYIIYSYIAPYHIMSTLQWCVLLGACTVPSHYMKPRWIIVQKWLRVNPLQNCLGLSVCSLKHNLYSSTYKRV